MNDLERELASITPRAAAVTLLLFDRVVARYEAESGYLLSEAEKTAVLTLLRRIVARDSLSDD